MWRLAFLGLSLLGCQAVESEVPVRPARLDPVLQPAFDELKAAVGEGSDEVARAILARLLPRCQDELSLEIADAYERILFGRELRDSMIAKVVIRDSEGGFNVSLSLTHSRPEAIRLMPGYARVEWTMWSMDARGRQSAKVGSRVVKVLEAWPISPDDSFEADLGVDSPRLGDSFMAGRVEWRISLGAGSAYVGSGRYPIQGIAVDRGVVVRLGRALPTGPVEPTELFRYALESNVKLSALLERAVRIQPSRYEESLDLLAELEPRFSPSAMQGVVPVISWLTGSTGIAGTGEEWRVWLKRRVSEKEAGGNLDLPDDRGR